MKIRLIGKNRRKFVVAIVLMLVVLNGNAQAKLSKSDFVKLDFKRLEKNKQKLLSNDPAVFRSCKALLKIADDDLNFKPVSVMEKTAFPPSGNKHDYMSIGPYWWPDPSKADGMPYIRKDGEINPEVRDYPDKENLPKLCQKIYELSLAYYFSDNEKYASHAARLVRVWFLDTATCMNPNVKFGQAIKGKNDGRAEGIIDTRHFIFLIDGLEILKQSKSWTGRDQVNMNKWFTAFLNWLMTSEIGKDEMNAKNNHGVWFDAQALAIASYINDNKSANEIVQKTVKRLDAQMNENGLFPFELDRTTSLHYSVFIMNAFTIVAELSEKTNTNLWTVETASGKTLKQAFDAIIPYISKEKEWKNEQIRPFNYPDALPVLLNAAAQYNCKTCIDAIKGILANNYDESLISLLY